MGVVAAQVSPPPTESPHPVPHPLDFDCHSLRLLKIGAASPEKRATSREGGGAARAQ
jgi:hypothetical protein